MAGPSRRETASAGMGNFLFLVFVLNIVFVCNLVQEGSSASGMLGISISMRGDNFVNVLRVVLCSLNGGLLSLHVHGDVRHLVNVLHSRYFDRFFLRFKWWGPVADSSDQLSPARSEGTVVPSVWLQTHVSLSTDACPTGSGHERLLVSSSCVQLQILDLSSSAMDVIRIVPQLFFKPFLASISNFSSLSSSRYSFVQRVT